jgi:hypothetical protein
MPTIPCPFYLPTRKDLPRQPRDPAEHRNGQQCDAKLDTSVRVDPIGVDVVLGNVALLIDFDGIGGKIM